MKKLSRQWIVNIAYSIVGKPLSEWVMEELGLYHPGMHRGIDPLLAALITVAVVFGVIGLLQRLSDQSHNNNP